MLRPDFSVIFMSVHFCTLERSFLFYFFNKLPTPTFLGLQLKDSSKLQNNNKDVMDTLMQNFQVTPHHRAKYLSSIFSDESPNQHLTVIIDAKWLLTYT